MFILSSAFVLGLVSLVSADSLISKRFSPNTGLRKRFIDENGNLNISIIHTNDIHAHLDQFRSGGTDCRTTDATCFGGYARIKTKVDELRGTAKANSTLLLDAGDQFQGTVFFNFYGGEKIAETLNQLGYDAGTLGNHEFDRGDQHLSEYISNLTFPVICANINTTGKLAEQLVPYKVFKEWDVAVVSVITPDTSSISNPGPNTTFSDPVKAVQDTVDLIHSKENVTRIIALTHIGYSEDIKLAQQTKGISLIIGGHSHTPIGNISYTQTVGDYPTIAKNPDGDEVFVVTAWRWGEVLGHIEVAWDPQGKIVAYEGGPIPLNTNTTKQDAKFDAQIQEWKIPFKAFFEEVLGETKTDLVQNTCRTQECTMGDLMSDAIVAYRNNGTTNVDGAFINSGGIRAAVSAGNFTRGDAITTFPFGNAVVDLKLTGTEILEVFEKVANNETISFIQISKEIIFEYNPTLPPKGKVTRLDIGGKPVEASKTYTIATLDFIAGGGDGFIKKEASSVLDKQDEVLAAYVIQHTPLEVKLDGRIKISNTTTTTASSGGNGALTSQCSFFLALLAALASVFSWI